MFVSHFQAHCPWRSTNNYLQRSGRKRICADSYVFKGHLRLISCKIVRESQLKSSAVRLWNEVKWVVSLDISTWAHDPFDKMMQVSVQLFFLFFFSFW